VPHLVPQILEDVGAVKTLHVSYPFGVQGSEIRAGEIEGDGDRHGLEGDSPFGREIEPGPDPGNPELAELLAELGQDWLQPGPFEGETEIPDGGGPEVRLVKPCGFGMYADKI